MDNLVLFCDLKLKNLNGRMITKALVNEIFAVC